MSEFVCPNGKLSVNGVCGIFEGPGKAVQDFTKKSTFDALKEDEILEEKDTKEDKRESFFKFDFEKPTESFNKPANNIINENINYYNEFVQDRLGISPQIQNIQRAVSAFGGLATGGGLMAAVGPFAIPFIVGGALRSKANKEQQASINRESTRDLQNRIDAGQFGSNVFTPQDERRSGQYNQPSSEGNGLSGGFDSAERGAALHG